MQQNDVPVVQAIHIENLSAEPLRDLELRVSVEPEFAVVWTTRIALIDAGVTYNLGSVVRAEF